MEGNRLYYDNLTVVKPSSKLTKEHRAFIAEFLKNNQDKFLEVMEELRYGNPRRYAELYVEMTKMVILKESNVNVNVGINRDFRDLHLLATTKMVEQKQDGEIVEKMVRMGPIEDVDYEVLEKDYNYAEDNGKKS